jgi:UDP-glucose 6-dehydrogenase
VKELAYSRALPLIDGLRAAGARVLAYDPLLTNDEIRRTGAEPWTWGTASDAIRGLVTQTADPRWNDLDPAWFPNLRAVLDGRNSLAGLPLPNEVARRGIGKT